MKTVPGLFAVFTALVMACGGSSDDPSYVQGKLNVAATTTQIGDFARNVGGDRIALTVLLKPNQDAHDFEPEPSQIRRLDQSDLILVNGVGLDAFVDKAVSGGDSNVVEVSQGIALRTGAEEDADADENDPHVWFAVVNAQRMVQNIRDAFVDADAANAGYYREQTEKYLRQLQDLDAEIRREVAQLPQACRKLVTNHDVLGYYADAYGFKLVGSVIPSVETNAQPSAADVAQIVSKIKQEGVPAIFAEASINPALIRQTAREAGVAVVDDLYGDSLGPKGSDGATYIGMMKTDTKKIVDALMKC